MNAFVRPVVPVQDVQAERCRRLFCHLIETLFKDATDEAKEGSLDQHESRMFMGSSRFYWFCSLAGVDGDYIMRGYRAKMAELGEAV